MTDEPQDKEQAKPPTPDTEAFLGWLEKVPDPVQRYSLATSELQKYQETVQRLSALRAGALADASEEDSLSALARRLGVSRQRAHQLVTEGRGKGKKSEPVTGRAAAAKRQKGRKDK
jgi:hypothetical protein